jgi:hypothetical protein
MTVCDLGCASSIVCAERFRTVAKPFIAGAHTPADLAPTLPQTRLNAAAQTGVICTRVHLRGRRLMQRLLSR